MKKPTEKRRREKTLAEKLDELAKECAALQVLDARSADEIIGYERTACGLAVEISLSRTSHDQSHIASRTNLTGISSQRYRSVSGVTVDTVPGGSRDLLIRFSNG
jgi:hypothetical protein